MNTRKIGILALGLLAAGALPATRASAAPYIYAVTVTTNFGTSFNDCFVFKGPNLFIQGLDPTAPLVTTSAPTKPKYYYTTVASDKLLSDTGGVNFAFAGYKTGTSTSGSVEAIGADSSRDSYTVSGTAVSACPTSDTVSTAKKWFRTTK